MMRNGLISTDVDVEGTSGYSEGEDENTSSSVPFLSAPSLHGHHNNNGACRPHSNGLVTNGRRMMKNGRQLVRNGLIRISMSADEITHSAATDYDRFPKEQGKAVVAVCMMFVAGMLNDLVLAYIHEKVPETPPLPDVFFSNTPYVPWALVASEYVMLSSFAVMVLVGLLHRHRWIMLRRVCFVGSILYFGRAVSMFVTQVPVADPKYFCSPKLPTSQISFSLVVFRALNLVSGVGLKLNGKHTLCGDYIYSGHTLILVSTSLFIQEYSPRKWWILHWLSWLLSLIGVVLLLLSRGHYTVDVLIAYWISTRIFWLYHTMAAYPQLKDKKSPSNLLSKLYWFPIFNYMECNVNLPVPRQFDWPFPWPSWSNRDTAAATQSSSCTPLTKVSVS